MALQDHGDAPAGNPFLRSLWRLPSLITTEIQIRRENDRDRSTSPRHSRTVTINK